MSRFPFSIALEALLLVSRRGVSARLLWHLDGCSFPWHQRIGKFQLVTVGLVRQKKRAQGSTQKKFMLRASDRRT